MPRRLDDNRTSDMGCGGADNIIWDGHKFIPCVNL